MQGNPAAEVLEFLIRTLLEDADVVGNAEDQGDGAVMALPLAEDVRFPCIGIALMPLPNTNVVGDSDPALFTIDANVLAIDRNDHLGGTVLLAEAIPRRLDRMTYPASLLTTRGVVSSISNEKPEYYTSGDNRQNEVYQYNGYRYRITWRRTS